MANLKISQLTAAGTLDGSELIEIVQGGTNKQTTTQDIADLASVGPGGGVESVTGSGVDNTDSDNPIIQSASATGQGTVELATPAECITGTDTERAVTPEGLQAKIDEESLGFNPADELTEIAGLTLEDNILAADLLAALAIPGCIPIHSDAAVGLTLTNMASALAVLPLGSTFLYLRYNTTNVRRMRLNARVVTVSASANNPRMYIQYSLLGSTWVTLGAGTIASGDAISMFTGATAVQYTNWITLPSEARGDSFFWRVVTEGGDGAADPVLGHIFIEYTT